MMKVLSHTYLLINIFLLLPFGVKAQDTLKVSVTHGHKIKKEYWKKDKKLAKITGFTRRSIGGMRGGHVEVHLKGFVYGFTDRPNAKIPHIFPRSKKNVGLFTKEDNRTWYNKKRNDKITYFYITLNKEQTSILQQKYEDYIQNSPYDFALFGKRCASSCYDMLMQVGILDTRSKIGINLGIFHPRKFRKILKKQAMKRNIRIEIQQGSKQKKWDKN